MNKKAQENNGIKDSISKLFILRDSCVGTCSTQKENPHIIWFEGAAVLLQQGVEKLKAAQQKISVGGEEAGKDSSANVKEIISKLVVLKRSWVASGAEETDENLIWFEGAKAIICEVIDQLQQAVQETSPQAVIAAAPEAAAGSAPQPAAEVSKAADAPDKTSQAAVAN